MSHPDPVFDLENVAIKHDEMVMDDMELMSEEEIEYKLAKPSAYNDPEIWIPQ